MKTMQIQSKDTKAGTTICEAVEDRVSTGLPARGGIDALDGPSLHRRVYHGERKTAQVMMLSVFPSRQRADRARMKRNDVVTMRVERQLPRNSRIIRLVSARRSLLSDNTWMEARTTPIDRASAYCSESGKEGLITFACS